MNCTMRSLGHKIALRLARAGLPTNPETKSPADSPRPAPRRRRIRRRFAAGALLAVAGSLMLAACGENQYGPPVPGKTPTWGQKHYLSNQRYQKLNEDRPNNR